MNARWYERWLIFQQARNSRAAYQAVAHYEDLSKAPQEIHDAMKWAFERE